MENIRLLWGIVARPRATFQRLNENGRRAWWLPALLAVIAVILPILVGSPLRTQMAREAGKNLHEGLQTQATQRAACRKEGSRDRLTVGSCRHRQ